jgi:CelD/BcsL family acetyltransferase involved in cellulose biosynthesis
LFKALDSRTRKNLKRHIKLLEREFSNITVQRLSSPNDLETIVQTSASIMSKTYQQGFETDWASDEMRARVRLWLKRGALTSHFLHINGGACAYQHILSYRGRAFAIGTAYDPAFRQYGIGRYIQLKALEHLCGTGVSEVDFGFGDAEYKRELCSIHRHEADLLCFAWRTAPIWANAARTLDIGGAYAAKKLLERTNLHSLVKKQWRAWRKTTALASNPPSAA